MLKNIVKGFVEMINAINEGAKEPFGTNTWIGSATRCRILSCSRRVCANADLCKESRKAAAKATALLFLPNALDGNLIYIFKRSCVL